MVQFFNCSKRKNRVQPPGSIPEWNSKYCLLKVSWFNSLKGDSIRFTPSQLVPIPFKKYWRRKGKNRAGDTYMGEHPPKHPKRWFYRVKKWFRSLIGVFQKTVQGHQVQFQNRIQNNFWSKSTLVKVRWVFRIVTLLPKPGMKNGGHNRYGF